MKKRKKKENRQPVSELKKTGRAFMRWAKGRLGVIVAVLCFVVLVAAIYAIAGKKPDPPYPEKYPENPEGAGTEYRAPPPDDREPIPDFVDLTLLSGTMVYAEVYQIMSYPEDYLGKTIKMGGLYSVSYSEQSERYFHRVLIEDALACCQQGLEFILNGERAYPDENAHIEVTGVFSCYEDDFGFDCYYLAADDISVVN